MPRKIYEYDDSYYDDENIDDYGYEDDEDDEDEGYRRTPTKSKYEDNFEILTNEDDSIYADVDVDLDDFMGRYSIYRAKDKEEIIKITITDFNDLCEAINYNDSNAVEDILGNISNNDIISIFKKITSTQNNEITETDNIVFLNKVTIDYGELNLSDFDKSVYNAICEHYESGEKYVTLDMIKNVIYSDYPDVAFEQIIDSVQKLRNTNNILNIEQVKCTTDGSLTECLIHIITTPQLLLDSVTDENKVIQHYELL